MTTFLICPSRSATLFFFLFRINSDFSFFAIKFNIFISAWNGNDRKSNWICHRQHRNGEMNGNNFTSESFREWMPFCSESSWNCRSRFSFSNIRRILLYLREVFFFTSLKPNFSFSIWRCCKLILWFKTNLRNIFKKPVSWAFQLQLLPSDQCQIDLQPKDRPFLKIFVNLEPEIYMFLRQNTQNGSNYKLFLL